MFDVAIFIALRTHIETARAALAASGLAPDEIGLMSAEGPTARFIALWTPSSDARETAVRNLPRAIGLGLAALVLLSASVSLWALYSANGFEAGDQEVASRIDDMRSAEASAWRPRALAALPPAERAWAMKEDSPVVVQILEALSRAMPENAYLTDLHLEDQNLRIMGRAADAPALIAALSRAKVFSDVRFFSPTVKSEDQGLYEFRSARMSHRTI